MFGLRKFKLVKFEVSKVEGDLEELFRNEDYVETFLFEKEETKNQLVIVRPARGERNPAKETIKLVNALYTRLNPVTGYTYATLFLVGNSITYEDRLVVEQNDQSGKFYSKFVVSVKHSGKEGEEPHIEFKPSVLSVWDRSAVKHYRALLSELNWIGVKDTVGKTALERLIDYGRSVERKVGEEL